ncbi:NADP-dependent isocitrate dehydrogenase [Glutamicibacter sp. NPDC087673]
MADPFPMLVLATSAKILSLDPPLARLGLFETGAGYQAE